MRLAARSTAIAAALAITMIASPVASARLSRESTTTTAHPQAAATAPAVVPNPDQQVAQVSRVDPPTLRSATRSQQPAIHRVQTAASHAFAYKPTASARYNTAGLNGTVHLAATGPGVVHIPTHNTQFDWGAAAIGAAGGLVISLLIVGGVLVTQRRQPKQTRAKALA